MPSRRSASRTATSPAAWRSIGIGLGIVQTLARAGRASAIRSSRRAVDWILNIALLIVGIWYLIELGILRGTHRRPTSTGRTRFEGRP